MKSIKIVPVNNFMLDTPFKLGNFIFVPPVSMISEYEKYDSEESTITIEEHNYILDIMRKLVKGDYSIPHILEKMRIFGKEYEFVGNYSFIIFEDEIIDTKSNPIDTDSNFVNVDRVSDLANKALDYIRINECNFLDFETMPGIPGYIDDGIKAIFQINNDDSIEVITGSVTMLIRSGIGLYGNHYFDDCYDDQLYKILFVNDNAVNNVLKYSLHRLCEAMYMNNYDTAYVYLLSTYEMLACPEKFINFQDAKPKILPFVTNSKSSYHGYSERLKKISKKYRTEIVHNGKSLSGLCKDKNEIIEQLNFFVELILSYCLKVSSLEITSFDKLEESRIELYSKLGM